MRNIMIKELRLSASVLSYLFIIFGLMFFIPGYPILCGVFFVTLGIFQSFQNARETNDILFSALLPVLKKPPTKTALNTAKMKNASPRAKRFAFISGFSL